MPLAGGDVQHIASRQHVHRLHLRARFVVQVLFEMAADAYDRLRRRSMPMHRHHGAGLDGVEHPLRLVFRRVAEIQVHTEAGRGHGQGSKPVMEFYNLQRFVNLAIKNAVIERRKIPL